MLRVAAILLEGVRANRVSLEHDMHILWVATSRHSTWHRMACWLPSVDKGHRRVGL
jgi:hypothetical protein